MGQRVIDAWVSGLVSKPFIWGINDCHQMLYEFVKITNPGWGDPHGLGKLKGTYSTPIEAARVAKNLKIKEWFEELGYTARPVNRVQTGDVVWVENKERRKTYDMYWPVVFNQTVIVGDPQENIIKLRHISELGHYDFKVYRRDTCQEQ